MERRVGVEFVLQVQIQSILSRFSNDFKRSEERALTALKLQWPLQKADRVTVGKSRISLLLKGDILEKQCKFFLFWQQQEFYVLEWLIGQKMVGSSKNSSLWSGLLELWTENAKTFGIFNNLLGFLGGRSSPE
ncbi:hypothetical protein SUGI_0916060 [Cryptomeria japonica]|nr:hypothetical protein SUGI_0916060 [Cryptomeria japonica]